jgi:hypothetical protein
VTKAAGEEEPTARALYYCENCNAHHVGGVDIEYGPDGDSIVAICGAVSTDADGAAQPSPLHEVGEAHHYAQDGTDRDAAAAGARARSHEHRVRSGPGTEGGRAAVSEISFDEVVGLIEGEDFAAFVQQTGGGCATVYASRKDAAGTLCTHKVGPYHDEHYEVAVGPGHFAGPGWTRGTGDTADLYVGIDGDETFEEPWNLTVSEGSSPQEVAAMAVGLLRRYDEWWRDVGSQM